MDRESSLYKLLKQVFDDAQVVEYFDTRIGEMSENLYQTFDDWVAANKDKILLTLVELGK